MTTLDIGRYAEPFPPFTNNRRKKNAYHAALARDAFKCARCGRVDRLTMHHRKPQAEGSPHEPDNLETLCTDCHVSEHRTKATA